jgi:hypothetical protein
VEGTLFMMLPRDQSGEREEANPESQRYGEGGEGSHQSTGLGEQTHLQVPRRKKKSPGSRSEGT